MRKNPVILLNMAVDVINNRENEVIISFGCGGGIY